jgi:hypothetical protein
MAEIQYVEDLILKFKPENINTYLGVGIVQSV